MATLEELVKIQDGRIRETSYQMKYQNVPCRIMQRRERIMEGLKGISEYAEKQATAIFSKDQDVQVHWKITIADYGIFLVQEVFPVKAGKGVHHKRAICTRVS